MSPAAFVHPSAGVQSAVIGAGAWIWQFCVVLPGAVIEAVCNICSHCFIENDVRVGDRATVECGVQLWDGVTLADDVIEGSNVSFANDPYPHSRRPRPSLPRLSRTATRRLGLKRPSFGASLSGWIAQSARARWSRRMRRTEASSQAIRRGSSAL